MTYIGASLASSLDGLHPRAQDEPYPLPISSLRAKDLVGSNGDKIGEESRLERQLSKLSARQTIAETTTCGRLKHRLLCCLFVLFFSSKTAAKSSYELGI